MSIERVLEPALTAKTCYDVLDRDIRYLRGTVWIGLTLPATRTEPWLDNASGARGFPVASTSLLPAPPVAVNDPSLRVPFLLTGIATTELFASLVMKYKALADVVTFGQFLGE